MSGTKFTRLDQEDTMTDNRIAAESLLDGDPREDEDRDEEWARERWAESANIASWSALHPETQRVLVDFARAARKHVEAERESRERTIVDEWDDMLARAEKAEAALADMTRQRDKYATEAEKWQARHADLRGAVVTEPPILRMAAADIEVRGTGFGGLPPSLPATLRGLAGVLARDTQRGAR